MADAPLPAAVEDAAEVFAVPVEEAVAAVAELLPDPPSPPEVDPIVAAAAAALIVRWEITSPSYYNKRLIMPIWPGGSSGITWCIGYDGGHQTRAVIYQDWEKHPEYVRLGTTAGITGPRAKGIVPLYKDIHTPYLYCEDVFKTRTLIAYQNQARRAYPGLELLRETAQAAIISLVYNRGSSKVGDNRREMKELGPAIKAQDYQEIAFLLRAMKRLWKGTINERGLSARREAEAIMVETVTYN